MMLTADGGQTWTAPSGEFDYFGGPLPVIQVGEAFFSTRHHGVNKSEDAGKHLGLQDGEPHPRHRHGRRGDVP